MVGRARSRVVILFGDPLRLVEARGGRVNQFRVVRVAHGPALSFSEGSDPHAAGRMLAQLLRQTRIKAKRAIAVLPAGSFLFRTLLLPPMPERELRQAAWGEVESYIHLPPEDVLLGLLTLGEVVEEGARRVQVLVAVGSRRTLESCRQAILAAGLRLEAIEIAPFAVLRSLILKGVLRADHHVCAVVIGDGEGAIAVASDGHLRLLRIGEYAPGGERAAALLADLRATLRYYETRISMGAGVERIVAVLDRPVPPTIPSALVAEFGGRVQFDELPPGVAPGQESLSPYLYHVTLGATLGRAAGVLLLPLRRLERLRPRRRVHLHQILAFLTLLVLIGTGYGIFTINRELSAANSRLQAVRKEVQELQAQLAARQEEATKQAKSVAAVLSRVQDLFRPPWSEVLSSLEKLPGGLWLTSMEVSGRTTMTIEGFALSPANVSDLLERLAGLPAFDQVVLRRAQEEELVKRQVVRFRIEATIRSSWGTRRGEGSTRE